WVHLLLYHNRYCPTPSTLQILPKPCLLQDILSEYEQGGNHLTFENPEQGLQFLFCALLRYIALESVCPRASGNWASYLQKRCFSNLDSHTILSGNHITDDRV